MHEAIHQLLINPRPQVPLDDDATGLQDFRRAARQYATLLRTMHINADQALRELPKDSPKRGVERRWIDTVKDRAAEILNALARSDIAAAELALDVTMQTLNPLPAQINKIIFGIVQELPLTPLLEALRSADGAQAQPDERQAIDAIAALRMAVLALVLEHTRWQELDNGLSALDDAFRLPATTAFRKFVRQWPPIRKQLQSLTEAAVRMSGRGPSRPTLRTWTRRWRKSTRLSVPRLPP